MQLAQFHRNSKLTAVAAPSVHLGLVSSPGPRHRSRHSQKRLRVAASYSSEPAGSSASILEAFYYGRAFAETLNERLGAALDDLLSELGKQDAERRESLRCGIVVLPVLTPSRVYMHPFPCLSRDVV